MQKIFSAPASIRKPTVNYRDLDFSDEERYINEIKAWAKTNGKGPNCGKEVALPFADGSARYVIVSANQLIHLDVGDQWQYPHINRLTSKDLSIYIVK